MKWILSLITLFSLVACTDAGPFARFRGGRGGCSGGSCGSGSCGSAAVQYAQPQFEAAPQTAQMQSSPKWMTMCGNVKTYGNLYGSVFLTAFGGAKYLLADQPDIEDGWACVTGFVDLPNKRITKATVAPIKSPPAQPRSLATTAADVQAEVLPSPVPLTGLPPWVAPQTSVRVEAPGVSVGVESEGRLGRRHIFPIFHRRGR